MKNPESAASGDAGHSDPADWIAAPGTDGCDPQIARKLSDREELVIQDARAYGGNLAVGIFDREEGCLYHFGEEVTYASAYELAERVRSLVARHGGRVEEAHRAFHEDLQAKPKV